MPTTKQIRDYLMDNDTVNKREVKIVLKVLQELDQKIYNENETLDTSDILEIGGTD